MTKVITELSSFPVNIVVPTPGEDVTAQSLEIPVTSLAYRSTYANDQLLEIANSRMAADWRRISDPFTGVSPEEASYNSGNNTWHFLCRSDTVAVSLGFPASAEPKTLVTAGGKSGISRLAVEDNSGQLTMFTVDSNTTVATNPDIWTYNGSTFSREALIPFAATTQFRTGAYLPNVDMWIYLGNEGATAIPAAYTSNDGGGNWSSQTIPAVSAERVYSSAYDVSNNRLVAVGTDTGGTNNVAWVTTDGATIAGSAIAGATNVQFVTHSAEEDLFMLTSIAANIITSYTSADGSSWSAGGSFSVSCSAVLGLACDSGYGGGDWRILAQTVDYGVSIFRSTDNGATWSPFNTLARTGAVSPSTTGAPVFKHLAGHWLCALSDGSSGAISISSEARIRPQET